MKKVIIPLLIIISLLGIYTYCLADMSEETEVTVYNQNFAVVKARRVLNIPKGRGEVKFQDVATGIDATSVHFKSLTEEACKVLDQNYEYDLVSSDKLLYKYIDQNISVITKDNKQYGGYLMSFDASQLVLAVDKVSGPITMVQRENIRDIQFPSLPSGLITRPTLVWDVASEKGGQQLIEVSYITGGMTWSSDYTVVLSGDEKTLDLGGWVTINNSSGAAYNDAKLKLIAGDVHRVSPNGEAIPPPPPPPPASSAGQTSFEEKSFFEYHMYTLGRPATIKENQIKQIELLTASAVPMNKIYIYDGAPSYNYYYDYFISEPTYGTQCNKKVSVMVEFKNSESNKLGIPLPKGKIRVYKRDDADGSLEFIGEDSIDHTPKDEVVRLFLGDAFDIVGERTQLSFDKIKDNIYDETFQMKLRNHKKESVTVRVVEHLYRWSDWKITESSQDYTKMDSRTIEFNVEIPPDGEKIVKYKVRYQF